MIKCQVQTTVMISINKANINKEKTNMNKKETIINNEEINILQNMITIKKAIHHIIVTITTLKHHKELDREIIQKNTNDLVNVIENNNQDKDQINMIIIDLLQKVI